MQNVATSPAMKSIIEITSGERQQKSLEPAMLEHAVSLFEDNGALWIKNVFDRELAAAYQQRYTSLGRSKLDKRHANVGHRRFMVTIKVEPPFDNAQLYANPILMQLSRKLLGEWCKISSFGSVVTFPDADEQPIHLDHPPLYESEELCAQLPTHAVTVVIPLVDVDQSVGSTAIWEGSHKSAGARHLLQQLMAEPDFSGSTFPLPQMGDVYMMDYRVIHGGMANESEIERPILYLVYGRPWFRDGFNFTDQPAIDISAEEFAKLPEEHRHLFAGDCR
jgi:ectoine hydroxylase-related dioxygenase (phytanoyl-CoA dioxygenase family)